MASGSRFCGWRIVATLAVTQTVLWGDLLEQRHPVVAADLAHVEGVPGVEGQGEHVALQRDQVPLVEESTLTDPGAAVAATSSATASGSDGHALGWCGGSWRRPSTLALPEEVPAAVRDVDDDSVLAAAVAGSADAIVTGDEDLLVLEQHAGVRIATVREFGEQAG